MSNMSLMRLNDRSKIVLLFSLLGGCLISFFTSGAYLLYSTNSKQLSGTTIQQPNLKKYCTVPRKKAENCLDDNGLDSRDSSSMDGIEDDNKKPLVDCTKALSNVSLCENAVTKAYKHINLGGCLSQIQAVSICKMEWCEDGMNHPSCQKECKVVKDKLNNCIDENVKYFLKKAGLNSDETISLS